MKRFLPGLALAAFLVAPGAPWAGTYVVSVSQIAEHPALDAVRRGFQDYFRQAGRMAERILLQGANPAEMPVESLDGLMLYVNPESAGEMGVTIPAAVMKRADKVIE